ncbi:MAG: hypothetical protein GY765_37085 [bacterium]|nr:hypothetical protein [bacterium]
MKGVTRSLKDVNQTPLNELKATRRARPITNFERGLELVRKDNEVDPVIQDHFGSLKRGMKAMSSPTASFDGLNFSANGAGWPPDTTGDVGLTYYIQAVNSSFGIFRKSDGVKVYSSTFDAFFGGTGISGTPCDSDNNGDPIVLFDRYNERWFILDFAWDSSQNDGSYFSIAASKTSDPTGDWWQYAFRADNTLMDDYPKAGVWHDGIYITANMFQFSGSFQHSKIWAIKTPDLYTGTITSQSVTDSGNFAFSLMPSNAKSATAPPSSAPNYIYAQDADEWGSGYTDSLKVWKYAVDWTNSSNTTWTGPTSMTVASYSIGSSKIAQQGTSNTVDTLYGRLMYAAPYMNFGTHESIYLSHAAQSGSTWGMRWYEIRISGGNSSIYQQGTYAPDSHHRWMGSVAADGSGNIAVGYSAASSSLYPSVRYAGRLASDTLGELSLGEGTIVDGGGSQTSYSRWGDYSTMSLDPSDNETMWYTQEYYSSSGTNWNTRIGAFKIDGTVIPPVTGDIGKGVDNEDLTYTDSGNADWTYVTDVYQNDDDAVKSGTITHSQTSTFATSVTLTGSQAVSFYWKVSSESGYDYLRFYVDGTLQDQIAGTVDWEQKSYTLAAGTHSLTWTYYKDGSVSSGSDCGWVDFLEIGDPVIVTGDLEDALDNTDVTVTTSGSGDWAVDSSIYYYDNDSIKSPTITHNQTASANISVSGVTSVKFYWKVSSEASYDYLRFYIDGSLQDQIAGTVDWEQKSYVVSSGSHTLAWTYYKDGSVSSGSDCGWVDKLELDTGTVTDPLGEALDNSSVTVSTSGDGTWAVNTDDYYYGSSSIKSPVITHSQDASAEVTISGVTSVSFYWKVSSESGYDYLRFYIDGTLQDSIAGTVNWAQKTYSVSSGSHTLKWMYDKDYSVSSGSDCGWVDRLVLN